MTTGRTVLIPNDPKKGNIPSNYRPITGLPIMYKVMTAMTSDYVYKHLEFNNMMPWEQKGCARSRGTKDQLIIDKSVIRDYRTYKKNLVIGWIDYRKAYDMVPHSWIEEVMGMMGIADNIKKFMLDGMQRWKTRLEYGVQLGGADQTRNLSG